MARHTFYRLAFKGIAMVILSACSLGAEPPESIFPNQPTSCLQENEQSEFLRAIYDEVQDLGRYGNDNFIKREFHLNLDGNQSNKEEHVVVLNHCHSGRKMMLVQVTYFESRRKNSPVKYAKMIREIECCILDKGIDIQRCDYDKTEIRSLLPSILQGIRENKKYLRHVRQGGLFSKG